MEAITHPAPADAMARLEAAFSHLRQHFVGRDNVLEQIFYALLTREHALIIGDRGLAKSRLARSVFAHIQDDLSPFSLQLTRSTSVGQLVGGLDLEKFERGTYVHNLDGYIVRAHFAFLDEVFDANDFVLRALNGILNEREFLNGPQVEKALLHTAIGTTNFIRDTRESRAVLDRLLFKSIVHRAESTLERFRIRREFLTSHGGTVMATQAQCISYQELKFVSGIVVGESKDYSIEVPPHLLVMLDELIQTYERAINKKTDSERFHFSDRTKNKAIQVLMASALRARREKVETRDLAALHFLIPTVGGEDEEEVFDDSLATVLKSFSGHDRDAIDRAASLSDLVAEMVTRQRSGTLNEPKWGERLVYKIQHWINKPSAEITLGSLMESARGLHADHAPVQKMKDEVIAQIREAHERYHIAFEQKMGG